jgi:hypothetical protein
MRGVGYLRASGNSKTVFWEIETIVSHEEGDELLRQWQD